MKVESTEVEGRKIYSVRAFNQGVASWLQRLPTLWVEGEVTELRRQERWASVFFTLKDPEDGACLAVQMPRGQFDGLRLELADGERVHVYGRPELYEQRGDFHLRALTIERYGLGAHLATLERLKQKLAAEGLFAAERERPLPRIPRLVGLVTGNDAAAKRDVLTAIAARFPPAHVLVAERYVQGGRAAQEIATAITDLCDRGADVIVIARGGGSFEDLLPFSDERLVRAVAASPVPVVTAVGHEQDTPLVDLAADARLDAVRRRAARRPGPDRARGVARTCARSPPARGATRLRASCRPSRGDPRPAAPGAAARLGTAQSAARQDARSPTCPFAASNPRARLRDRARRRAGRSRAARGRGRAGGRGRRRLVRGTRRMSGEPTFEAMQAELEGIVERLERGDVDLGELTKLWERGEELYRRLSEQLAGAQGKIEELARRLGDDAPAEGE